MLTFNTWLEMANILPQRRGDTLQKSATTHMGIPVYAPTITYLILNRPEKYIGGLTSPEIGDEILKQSELRTELKPGEQEGRPDWESVLRSNKTIYGKFLRGISSMLARNVDNGKLVVVGNRETLGLKDIRTPERIKKDEEEAEEAKAAGEDIDDVKVPAQRGRSPAVYFPSQTTIDQGGMKFLKGDDRIRLAKTKQDQRLKKDQEQAEKEELERKKKEIDRDIDPTHDWDDEEVFDIPVGDEDESDFFK